MSYGCESYTFFEYQYFNFTNVASVRDLEYLSNGSIYVSFLELCPKYGHYYRYALNNKEKNRRYFYGTNQDAINNYLGILSAPSMVIGIQRVEITQLSTPDIFLLQSESGDMVAFSNNPIAPGSTVTFTPQQGDR